MLTAEQLQGFLVLPPDCVTEWFNTGSGSQGFDGTCPPMAGIYEIQEDEGTEYMNQDIWLTSIFMQWSPERPGYLKSVDPRTPSLSIFAGGGFVWRARIGPQGSSVPFASFTPEAQSPVYVSDREDDYE